MRPQERKQVFSAKRLKLPKSNSIVNNESNEASQQSARPQLHSTYQLQDHSLKPPVMNQSKSMIQSKNDLNNSSLAENKSAFSNAQGNNNDLSQNLKQSSPRENLIYQQLENASQQNLSSIWEEKNNHKQPGQSNQDNAKASQQNIQKQISDYKKQLSDECQQTLKQQINAFKESHEKDYNLRINALKDGYMRELKTFKEQHQQQRTQLKSKEKLIQKLLRICVKHEFQLSTEDYRLYLEFDREPQLNMLDLSKIKQDQQKKQYELDKIEIDTQEYIEMKTRIKDLETQNQQCLRYSQQNAQKQTKDYQAATNNQQLWKLITHTNGFQRSDARGSHSVSSSQSPDKKIIVDMMKIGIPPRPQEEVKEEIEIIHKANVDKIVYNAVQKMKQEMKLLSLQHEKELQEKDEQIKIVQDKLEKLRVELRKAVLLLRQKNQQQQYQMLKVMQNSNIQDIQQVVDKGLENLFDAADLGTQKDIKNLTVEEQDQAIIDILNGMKQAAKERQPYNMKTLKLQFFDQQIESSLLPESMQDVSMTQRSMSQSLNGVDEALIRKYLVKKSKHPVILKMQLQEVLKKIKMQNKESAYLSESDIDIEKTLQVHRLLQKNPNGELLPEERSQFKDQIKQLRKMKLIQQLNDNRSRKEIKYRMKRSRLNYGGGLNQLDQTAVNNTTILKPIAQTFRSKTPLINSKQKKQYRNITIQQMESDDIGYVNPQHQLQSKKDKHYQITHLQLVSTALALKKIKAKKQQNMNKTQTMTMTTLQQSPELNIENTNESEYDDLSMSQSPIKPINMV
ncbi:UNKNOWN [Stylonychia lemnae]|uniref:Uncharacterized protein n=1 Tax=Stylonychia lemnae TaxID=5949 RepID=A0A078A2B1_STYLE|nr:UNKNOWN [Stylonychia lemnae]|eukprot:CDW75648.1 UNKNOWN [Stylonychia lemnae]